MLVLRWNQRAHYWFWGRPKGHIRGTKGHSALWKRPSENLGVSVCGREGRSMTLALNYTHQMLHCILLKITTPSKISSPLKSSSLHVYMYAHPPSCGFTQAHHPWIISAVTVLHCILPLCRNFVPVFHQRR